MAIRDLLTWWPEWPEDCDIPLVWRALLVTAGALTWAWEIVKAFVVVITSRSRTAR